VSYLSIHTGPVMDDADSKALLALQVGDIIDNYTSASIVNPLSANIGRVLFNLITNNTANTVLLTGAQSINGTKSFVNSVSLQGGFIVAPGQTGSISTVPTNPDDIVNKLYVDSIAGILLGNAGAGISFLAGAPSKLSADIVPVSSGLKFDVPGDTGRLQVDINGLVSSIDPNTSDEILIYDILTNSLKKTTREAFLGDTTRSIKFKGTWDAFANFVSGDPLNANLAKAVAPAVDAGENPIGSQYICDKAGLQDITGDGTLESINLGDQVIWTGTEWLVISTKPKPVEYVLLIGDNLNISSIDLTLGTCLKVIIHAVETITGEIHTMEVMASAKGAVDSYCTIYAEVMSNYDLFIVDSINDGSNLNINITATKDITIAAELVAVL